jgi:hypothetical protein
VIYTTDNMEARFRRLSIGIVFLSGAAFALGVILYAADQSSRVAALVLQAGLLLLMAAPGVRILVATAERLRRRDWTFLLMTAVVVMELAVVMWRAAQK